VNLPGFTLYQIRPWLIFGIVILLITGTVPAAVAGLAAEIVAPSPETTMAAAPATAEKLPIFLTLSPRRSTSLAFNLLLHISLGNVTTAQVPDWHKSSA
jgi:hypothetical protein